MLFTSIHNHPQTPTTQKQPVTAPLFAVNKWHRPLYRSWEWNLWSFFVLSAYHWLMLLPWGIYSGIK